jgi:2-polyprenyl-3-methyl-5-hydroxy-6-metoxy-1,4-benzoquinol methylase
MASIHYNLCPVCGSTHLTKVLAVNDYTVSKEDFQVWECATCSLRFTQDVPNETSIIPYYKSEEYISHSNTDKGLINTLYKAVRKLTLTQKRKLVKRVTGLKKGVLLDVGSGTGAFASEMQQHGWLVTGLEPDEGARKIAQKDFGIKLQPTDRFYQLPPASFDAITLWHVLEHVHDLHRYIAQLKILLKPGGKLLIAVPNYTSLDADIYKEFWAAYDVPRHLYHFSPPAIRKLMEKHQMAVVGYKPMWFDSFYICLLSSKYKNGNTRWLPAILNGLRSNAHAWGKTKRCSSVIYILAG